MGRWTLLAWACVGCGDASWTLEAWGEDFAERGIPAEAFADGCDVVFDEAAISTSNVALVDLNGRRHEGPGAGYVDLQKGRGVVVDLAAPAGRYAHVEVDLDEAATVAGTLTCGEQAVRFDWSFPRAASYQCETADLVVDDSGTAVNEFTVHMDHFFIDAFGNEEPDLRGGHILAADRDGDGEVSLEELEATPIAGLDIDPGDVAVTSLHDWMDAISGTLGHIDGETHCNPL